MTANKKQDLPFVWKGNPRLEPFLRPVDELHEDPANARRHSEKNLGAIHGSLKTFGQRKLIVYDKNGTIKAGNGTFRTAKALGWTHIAGVQDDDDPAVLAAFAIADNRTGELAEWDTEVLLETLDVLKEEYDLDEVLGFDQDDLDELMEDENGSGGGDPLEDPEPPSPPEAPQSALGDIWILGGVHRVICGDSTDPSVIASLMDGEKAEMCFTDPPWNVAIGTDKNPKHRQREGLINDNMSTADFADWLDKVAKILVSTVTGDLYCVLGASEWPSLDRALRDAGYHWSATIIWVKDIFVLGRSKYHRRYEPIWYGWPTKGKSTYKAGRDQDDVWEFPRPKVSKEHPTMKPIDLVAQAIRNSSKTGDLVFDPFLGSGTTLLAGHQLERVCYGVELDPRYVDVILQRYHAITGDVPVTTTGKTFTPMETTE